MVKFSVSYLLLDLLYLALDTVCSVADLEVSRTKRWSLLSIKFK